MTYKNLDKYITFGIFIIILFGIFFVYNNLKSDGINIKDGNNLEAIFMSLSSAKSNQCSGPSFINGKNDNERLQGSCCSQMDFHRYEEQIEGLKKYSNIDKIPKDPYDIPVSLARELLEYQKTIKLTEEQQAVYDEAMKMSHEGGPCCCKCWRWYAFEGLAKYLIVNYNFNAEQIAEVWDLEDGCGGKGHEGHEGHEGMMQTETFESRV